MRRRSIGRASARSLLAALAALGIYSLAFLALGPPQPARAVAGTNTVIFTSAGEHAFTVPNGCTSLHVAAIGQQGGGGGGAGGMGGQVSGDVTVPPGATQYFAEVNVGGGPGASGPSIWSGGGGGASDLRTCSAAAGSCSGGVTSLATRLLVAAGGGGGGGGAWTAGGAGGAAGSASQDGQHPLLTLSGHGGGAGSAIGGGAGGAGASVGGDTGAPGLFGVGGGGGQGGFAVGVGGGAGGGGYYGGGGGGAVSYPTGDAGGGGGGSSYTGTIANPVVGPAPSSTASVAVSFTDTSAPSVSLDALPARSTDTTPTFSGNGGTELGDALTVAVRIFRGSSGSGQLVQTLEPSVDPGTGAYSVDASPALADGTFTVHADQRDGTQPSPNVGTSPDRVFTIDTTAPRPTLTAPAAGARTNDTTPTLSGTAGRAAGDSPTLTVELYAGSSASGSPLQTRTATVAPGTGAYSVAVSPGLADATYTARASQSDDLAHTGASAPVTFTVDTHPPDTWIGSGPSGGTADTTPTFAFASSEPGSTFVCRVDERAFGRCPSLYTCPELAGGSHVVQVAAVDRAGNVDRGPASRSFAVLAFGPRTLATLKLAKARIPAAGPLRVRITNTNGFTITGRLSGETTKRISVSRKRRIKLKAKAFAVGAHAKKTVTLNLPKDLKRLLARKHTLTLRLTAKVKDPAGYSRSVKKTLSPRLANTRRR